jgi:hypothetical protein
MAYEPSFNFRDPDFLQAIGELVVSWNGLERVLHVSLVWVLDVGGDRARAHIVFAHMSFPQKLQAMRAMVAEMINGGMSPSSPLGKFERESFKLLYKANEKRNTLMHHMWAFDSEEKMAFQSSVQARKRLEAPIETFSLEELKEISRSWRRITAQLGRAMSDQFPDFLSIDNPHMGQ